MKNRTLLDQAKYLRNLKGDLAGAIRLLENGILKLETIEQPAGYLALGILYSDTGKKSQSQIALNQALTLSRSMGNKLVEADTLRRQGWEIWLSEKDSTAAITLAQQASKIIARQTDLPYLGVKANIYALIGNIKFGSKDYVGAEKSYRQALKITRSINYYEREATLLGDLGNLALRRKKYSLALKYLLQAEELGDKYQHHELPAALTRLGRLYSDSQNPDYNPEKAREYFQQALEISQREGWQEYIESSQTLLAQFQ
jgi:tetratricopeptide (TPR) repeat protein